MAENTATDVVTCLRRDFGKQVGCIGTTGVMDRKERQPRLIMLHHEMLVNKRQIALTAGFVG